MHNGEVILPALPIGGRHVDEYGYDEAGDGDEGPDAVVYIDDDTVPEQYSRCKDETEDRPQQAVESSFEPVREKPDDYDHHSGNEECEESQ
jgi:hypothetical protein